MIIILNDLYFLVRTKHCVNIFYLKLVWYCSWFFQGTYIIYIFFTISKFSILNWNEMKISFMLCLSNIEKYHFWPEEK